LAKGTTAFGEGPTKSEREYRDSSKRRGQEQPPGGGWLSEEKPEAAASNGQRGLRGRKTAGQAWRGGEEIAKSENISLQKSVFMQKKGK